jgi:single-strand DNA-binding protein
MTVNKAILVGNLGQDPEIRSTGSGTPVATLRIATSDRRKDRDGNWTDHTEWHTVVVFGRQAENVGRFCRKGKQLFIEGRIQTRKWQDKEGRDRYNTEIVANDVRFLGGRGEGASDNYSGGSSYGGGGYGGGGGGGGYGGGNANQGGGNANQGGGNANQGGGNAGGEMPYRDDEIPF